MPFLKYPTSLYRDFGTTDTICHLFGCFSRRLGHMRTATEHSEMATRPHPRAVFRGSEGMRGMEAILCHAAQAIWCVVQLAGARHGQSSSAGQRLPLAPRRWASYNSWDGSTQCTRNATCYYVRYSVLSVRQLDCRILDISTVQVPTCYSTLKVP